MAGCSVEISEHGYHNWQEYAVKIKVTCANHIFYTRQLVAQIKDSEILSAE